MVEIEKLGSDATPFELIKQLKDKNTDVVRVLWDAKQLVSVLKTADDVYYNDGASVSAKLKKLCQSVITDNVYDELVDILKTISPNNKYLSKIGAPVSTSPTSHASMRMIELPFAMASLDKLKPENVDKWALKHKEIIVSDKVDGVSLGITCDGKGNISLFTRGDGSTGQSLDYLIPHIKSLSPLLKHKKEKFSIRGEIVMPRDVFFEKYQEKYANPRNLVSGIVNKGSISSAFNDIMFVGYSVVYPELNQKDAVKFLKNLGINTPNFTILKNPCAKNLSDILADRKQNAPYDIDGLVISCDAYEKPSTTNPKNSKAYKDSSLIDNAVVKVLDVDWQLGKTKTLTPVIYIEPVFLDGAKVSKVTGHNAKQLVEKKIGPGAMVRVVRSGSVIPYVQEVIEPANKVKMPDMICHWEGVHLVIDEEASSHLVKDALKIKRITTFYRTLGVENISEKIFEKLYNHGYNSIFKIAKINENDLLDIPGFKSTMANKIVSEISNSLKEVTLAKAMYGSCIFDRVLGLKRIEQITSEIPVLLKKDKDELIAAIIHCDGLSLATAAAFADGIEPFKKFLAKLEGVASIVYPEDVKKPAQKSNSLNGQVIVFTGFRNKDWSNFIAENGGKEGSSVSGKTTILVVKDKNSTSTKTAKAKELGVKIMDIGEFEKYLKNI